MPAAPAKTARGTRAQLGSASMLARARASAGSAHDHGDRVRAPDRAAGERDLRLRDEERTGLQAGVNGPRELRLTGSGNRSQVHDACLGSELFHDGGIGVGDDDRLASEVEDRARPGRCIDREPDRLTGHGFTRNVECRIVR